MIVDKKRWITALLLAIMGLKILFPDTSMAVEPSKYLKDLRGGTVLVPPSAPEREHLVLVSFVNVTTEAGFIGAMVIYDDPGTNAQTDYVELYDGSGGLVSVSWLDPFGIRRTALDSGLLLEEDSELQGLLVLLTEGLHL